MFINRFVRHGIFLVFILSASPLPCVMVESSLGDTTEKNMVLGDSPSSLTATSLVDSAVVDPVLQAISDYKQLLLDVYNLLTATFIFDWSFLDGIILPEPNRVNWDLTIWKTEGLSAVGLQGYRNNLRDCIESYRKDLEKKITNSGVENFPYHDQLLNMSSKLDEFILSIDRDPKNVVARALRNVVMLYENLAPSTFAPIDMFMQLCSRVESIPGLNISPGTLKWNGYVAWKEKIISQITFKTFPAPWVRDPRYYKPPQLSSANQAILNKSTPLSLDDLKIVQDYFNEIKNFFFAYEFFIFPYLSPKWDFLEWKSDQFPEVYEQIKANPSSFAPEVIDQADLAVASYDALLAAGREFGFLKNGYYDPDTIPNDKYYGDVPLYLNRSFDGGTGIVGQLEANLKFLFDKLEELTVSTITKTETLRVNLVGATNKFMEESGRTDFPTSLIALSWFKHISSVLATIPVLNISATDLDWSFLSDIPPVPAGWIDISVSMADFVSEEAINKLLSEVNKWLPISAFSSTYFSASIFNQTTPLTVEDAEKIKGCLFDLRKILDIFLFGWSYINKTKKKVQDAVPALKVLYNALEEQVALARENGSSILAPAIAAAQAQLDAYSLDWSSAVDTLTKIGDAFNDILTMFNDRVKAATEGAAPADPETETLRSNLIKTTSDLKEQFDLYYKNKLEMPIRAIFLSKAVLSVFASIPILKMAATDLDWRALNAIPTSELDPAWVNFPISSEHFTSNDGFNKFVRYVIGFGVSDWRVLLPTVFDQTKLLSVEVAEDVKFDLGNFKKILNTHFNSGYLSTLPDLSALYSTLSSQLTLAENSGLASSDEAITDAKLQLSRYSGWTSLYSSREKIDDAFTAIFTLFNDKIEAATSKEKPTKSSSKSSGPKAFFENIGSGITKAANATGAGIAKAANATGDGFKTFGNMTAKGFKKFGRMFR